MIYFDASALISMSEGSDETKEAIFDLIFANDSDGHAITSELSWAECIIVPRRNKDQELIDHYQILLHEDTDMKPITYAILDAAAHLRVRYGLKVPDCIHIATAIEHGASHVLTADKMFTRCNDIPILLFQPVMEDQ